MKKKVLTAVFLCSFHLFANQDIIDLSQKENLALVKNDLCSAKIVALGENSHFVKEFFEVKDSMIKLLIRECNTSTIAYEIGFIEGLKIDRWIKGDGKEEDIDKLLSHFYYPNELKGTLSWIRRYNHQHHNKITFLGLDLPRNGGSLYPNLQVIADFIVKNDLNASESDLIESIRPIAGKLDFDSAAQVVFTYDTLSTEEKNTLTAALEKLKIRFENLEPLYRSEADKRAFDITMHSIDGLVYFNYNMSSMSALLKGNAKPSDMGTRDKYMSDIVSWYATGNPGSKIVLLAHNAHIQKTPVAFDGFISSIPLGVRLDQAFGEKYLALGITSLTGNTAALYPDKDQKYGFKVDITTLEPPVAGSIESYLSREKFLRGYLFFRCSPDGLQPDKIRFDSAYLTEDIKKAFDGMIFTQRSTISEVVR